MSTVTHEHVEDVHVGDTAPALEIGFLEADGETLRDLTGHVAWLTFWHSGQAPHVWQRQAPIDYATRLILYELQGDEYDVPDEKGVIIQATIACPTEGAYVNGDHFFETSFPPFRRIVKRSPT